ncbi:ferric-rhodotorulic acid/ferric-coprogen receptor FhuE [Luteibacter anthropi]|uniref:ferric-rhodotorulic acid/ferric-coprogen receptor FhuE n=1 Tax=Luteibacter anthropi TaxID=564369 RepID=UPI0020325103|nr:ferric-rhodotorulic acid/ferric-coprogen receptor FhuE [Luteibacter anthropi]URX61525.1 ferric-rhodotorulic acid/ferric-coprogen receptor FhuE [Luteibacter anthropi]
MAAVSFTRTDISSGRRLLFVFAMGALAVPGIVHAGDTDTDDTTRKARRDTATRLEGMQVNAAAEKETTEGTGSYTTRITAAATRLPLSIKDTPQSVSVITRQRLDDSNMQSLSDVLAGTTGISSNSYDSERISFYSRGFLINSYQYDGIPTTVDDTYNAGDAASDTAIYDRVEVVRGATGLLTGAGNPSASVNLVRKHANATEPTASVSAGYGSWNNRRVTADASTPLNRSGSVRARVVGVYQDRDSYMRFYSNKKKLIYATLDADLGPDTLLSVGYTYQRVIPRAVTWGGTPIFYADGGSTDFSRSVTTAAKWSSWASTAKTAFATLTQGLGADWTLRANASHSSNDYDAKLLFVSGYPDRRTGLGMTVFPAWYLGGRQQNSLDLYANGPFQLWGRDHEAVIGWSVNQQSGDTDAHPSADLPGVGNFYAWDGNFPRPAWGAPYRTNTMTTRQTGLYTALRFSLADPLKLIVGGRYSGWRTDQWSYGSVYRFNRKVFTPYAGLVWSFNDTYSAYLSYTDIFNPQSYQDRNGRYLDPVTGKNYELGMKAAWLGGRLNASVAVFDVKQDNLGQPDANYMVPGTTNQAYRAAKGTTTKGYEAELSGELATGWNATFGVSHYTAKDASGADVNTAQPRTSIKLLSTYDLPGSLRGLTVGGGVNWQSSNYTAIKGPLGNPVRATQPAYALVSALARYRFNDRFSMQFNADNLLDKKYYQQIGFYTQGMYGAPRNYMVTATYDL